MTTKKSRLNHIQIVAGVEPSTDSTATSTPHFTFSDKIRFRNGLPEKIGGWASLTFDNDNTLSGACRSLYSAVISNSDYLMAGTHTRLYALVGSRLTNVTPLSTTTTAIPNSIETDYNTLAADPITTVSGSKDIVIADAQASLYVAGDTITFSGSTAVNGIPAGDINKEHIIRSVGTNQYTLTVATAATSSGTGGGATVTRATGLIRITIAGHGLPEGDRVAISGAAATGGILAVEINNEFVIRGVQTNTIDVLTEGLATSAVSGGGGAGVLYQAQIDSGNLDESYGYGYGMGLYGVGLYGTALISVTGRRYPRIWFFDRYADSIITTAGNQSGVYTWDGDLTVAPALVTNAPTAVNYAFISDNILVTFGAGNVDNKIFASDQGKITQWTASSTNKVFDDLIEGAGRLLSHAPLESLNLIFTSNQTYKFKYIGLPLVWDIELLDGNVGIIASQARCVVNGVAYWMGQNNFYMYRGGNVEIMPSNTQAYSTILSYVYDNLTESQRSKVFCWYNEKFDEIWWHYPSAGGNDPDLVARYNVSERTWCPDSFDRVAAEYPIQGLANHRLVDSNNTVYYHELGNDDDTSPMAFTLTSNKRFSGKDTEVVSGLIPDSIQEGDITVTINSYNYPQSTTSVFSESYTVSPTTEFISTSLGGRVWQITLSGSELDQEWRAGQWYQYIQEGATK